MRALTLALLLIGGTATADEADSIWFMLGELNDNPNAAEMLAGNADISTADAEKVVAFAKKSFIDLRAASNSLNAETCANKPTMKLSRDNLAAALERIEESEQKGREKVLAKLERLLEPTAWVQLKAWAAATFTPSVEPVSAASLVRAGKGNVDYVADKVCEGRQ